MDAFNRRIGRPGPAAAFVRSAVAGPPPSSAAAASAPPLPAPSPSYTPRHAAERHCGRPRAAAGGAVRRRARSPRPLPGALPAAPRPAAATTTQEFVSRFRCCCTGSSWVYLRLSVLSKEEESRLERQLYGAIDVLILDCDSGLAAARRRRGRARRLRGGEDAGDDGGAHWQP